MSLEVEALKNLQVLDLEYATVTDLPQQIGEELKEQGLWRNNFFELLRETESKHQDLATDKIPVELRDLCELRRQELEQKFVATMLELESDVSFDDPKLKAPGIGVTKKGS